MKRGLVLAVLTLLVLGACGGRVATPRPPAIRYGVDVSEHGMIIGDERFAAAALPASGVPILFDDTGELFKYRQARPQTFRALYVKDYATREWLQAEQAWYLLSPRLQSPMGWGLAAFATEGAARRQQAAAGGDVLDWTATASRDWKRPGY